MSGRQYPSAAGSIDNLTAYDAAYVALAEVLGALLLTADGPLKRAAGVRCEIEVLLPLD